MPDYLARFIPGTSPNRKGFRERGKVFGEGDRIAQVFQPGGSSEGSQRCSEERAEPLDPHNLIKCPGRVRERIGMQRRRPMFPSESFSRTCPGGVMFWGIPQGFPHPSATPG